MSVSAKREEELRNLVRHRWDDEVKDALDGSELLMKEIWEEISDDEEDRIVKNELRKVRADIKASASSRSDLDVFIGLLNKGGRTEAADGPDDDRYRETTYIETDYGRAGTHISFGDKGRKVVTFIFKTNGNLDNIVTSE